MSTPFVVFSFFLQLEGLLGAAYIVRDSQVAFWNWTLACSSALSLYLHHGKTWGSREPVMVSASTLDPAVVQWAEHSGRQ